MQINRMLIKLRNTISELELTNFNFDVIGRSENHIDVHDMVGYSIIIVG